MITAYNADLRNGHAYLALIVQPSKRRALIAHDANLLFINYLLTGWAFRKLYGETSERNLESLFPGAVGRYVKVEARLVDHEHFDGQYWDTIIMALYRSDWEAIINERLPRILVA